MTFIPDQNLLKKYADVLVKFALRSGAGSKKDDVIFVQIPECAKPMYIPLQKAILEAGAHPIFEYYPDGVSKHFFDHANDDQIVFYPEHFFHGKVEQMTHVISIIAENDPHELKEVDPKRLTARLHSRKPYRDKRSQKENEGKLTRTAALYGTQAMADEAKLPLKEYREQITKACYLDHENPIQERKKAEKNIEKIKTYLDNLHIKKVHITGEDVDLHISLGEERQWLGGSGRNIPSFEIFTSPDRRGTNGKITFNQPLYSYGNMISGISLEFKDGIITHFSAKENEALLKEIINMPNANKLGEFSLTDKRLSHISKFMGETLYDENFGGEYGNTHIAIGSSFEEAYTGEEKPLTKEKKETLGLNECSIHNDIISTTNRTVTATLEDGTEKIIYKDGMFMIDF